MDISALLNSIRDTHQWFAEQAARQIDTSLTLRNWLIGMYLVEYEQKGQDRAQYGNALYQTIAARAKSFGLRGMGKSNLYGFRTFYLSYSQIFQFLTEKFQPSDNQLILRITEHASEQIQIVQSATGNSSGIVSNDINQLLNRLCAEKNRALVHYATGNLPQPVFVSKYLVNLPSEKELLQIIQEEQGKL